MKQKRNLLFMKKSPPMTEQQKQEDACTIFVTPALVYNREEYRPSCEKAQMFAELLGQKNLTRKNIDLIKKMGFVVRIKETTL